MVDNVRDSDRRGWKAESSRHQGRPLNQRSETQTMCVILVCPYSRGVTFFFCADVDSFD